MMNETTPTNLFGDIVKLLEQYKLPGIDIAAIIEMRRKDIEALMTANRVALKGAQSIGQKQVEIPRSTLDQLSSLIQQATAPGSMTEKTRRPQRPGELVQQVLQRALENMRELAETAYKSQSDTYAVLTKRRLDQLIEDTVGRISNLLEEGTELSAALTAFSADRAVRIMSIHKSKGLEFDTVIMMGVEEETFWGKIDEERSAHFVGISRAKNRLLLTVCDHRDRPEGATRWTSARTAHTEFLGYAEAYA